VRSNLPVEYKGVPYHDDVYQSGAQIIPGKVQCALYDIGGEGISYHDKDSINRGSGEYNYQPGHCEPGSDYVCHFREKEGVDLSYTKSFLDFNHPNPFVPGPRQLYIGWANDGEWCTYTVNVKKAGIYQLSVLYSNNNGTFKITVNNELPQTFQLPIKTASYHTWNMAPVEGTIKFLKPGLNLIKLEYNGGNNFAYLDFKSVKK
jgi:hypothetical protein